MKEKSRNKLIGIGYICMVIAIIFLGTSYIINHKSHTTEQTYVDVKIVAEYFNKKTISTRNIDTEIIVEYKDQLYTLYDYDTYRDYHNRVDETVKAKIKITKYSDGTEKVQIIKLIS